VLHRLTTIADQLLTCSPDTERLPGVAAPHGTITRRLEALKHPWARNAEAPNRRGA